MTKAYERLLKCYQCFKDKINFKPEVALVLGSGLGDYADTIRVEAVLDYQICLWIRRRCPGRNHAGTCPLL